MELLMMLQPMLALLQGSSDLYLVGFGFASGTAVIGSGIGMGYLFGQTIASIHRQPEAFELSGRGSSSASGSSRRRPSSASRSPCS